MSKGNRTYPSGADLIAMERQRQIEGEGWTPQHDDEHTDGSLAMAAVCYATPVRLYVKFGSSSAGFSMGDPWPVSWDSFYDKRFEYGSCRKNPGNVPPNPSTYSKKERIDLLVKAGALIAAEIDRLQRREK